ncbi:uncharacterized protein N7479_007286 [Penicillium vulpinum]|uniref:Uncharacterized protein n=1 Tax=Penicillium vulpinum TaxID=29845 RepID=A0A1V6S126_9EURO|nr:uncharacterized protein N7479_007286 [Penicillium vulpinum]KAJ5960136.1 hypothetical protein N7479_007286 [Penicillium vulpinum]OQE07568.1 hypothetical protein PENVUL_c013G05618 [Penicillium vulpinum]
MFPRILLSVVFLFGLLGSVLSAGELGITRDTSLGADVQAYNSKCTFITQPSDAEFLKMIEAAFQEMQALPGTRKEKAGRPAAMIGLSIDNEVYFSSSVKGMNDNPLIYQKVAWRDGKGELNPQLASGLQEVTDALTACSTPENKQHGNQASCGELMSSLLWLVDNQGESLAAHHAKVAAYYSKGYLPPCHAIDESDTSSQKWGCSSWTRKVGLAVVGKIESLPADFPRPVSTQSLMLQQCLVKEVKQDETDQNQLPGL